MNSPKRRDLGGPGHTTLAVTMHQITTKRDPKEECSLCPGRPLIIDSVHIGGRGYVRVLRCSSPGCGLMAREATIDDYSNGKAN